MAFCKEGKLIVEYFFAETIKSTSGVICPRSSCAGRCGASSTDDGNYCSCDFMCPFLGDSVRWRHTGCDSVSNHQPRECLLRRLIRRTSKKTSKLRVTGLCAGNSPVTGEFPAQMVSNAENVSIWWRHHDHDHDIWWRHHGCRDVGSQCQGQADDINRQRDSYLTRRLDSFSATTSRLTEYLSNVSNVPFDTVMLNAVHFCPYLSHHHADDCSDISSSIRHATPVCVPNKQLFFGINFVPFAMDTGWKT